MEGLKITGQGGPGRGQGRKPTGRKKVVYYITDEEAGKMSELLWQMREASGELPAREVDPSNLADLTEILKPRLENERDTVRKIAAIVKSDDIDAMWMMIGRVRMYKLSDDYTPRILREAAAIPAEGGGII